MLTKGTVSQVAYFCVFVKTVININHLENRDSITIFFPVLGCHHKAIGNVNLKLPLSNPFQDGNNCFLN